MKKSIYFFIAFALFVSCTDRGERDEFNYNVSINNSTTVSLVIEGYAPNNDLIINNLIINSNATGADCNYQAELFSGYICGVDSLIFKFPNGKGYICDLRQSGNNLCFPNKFIFSEEGFTELTNKNYQFVITEEDYNNAYDLP